MPLSFPASWANDASEESFLATTGFEEDPDAKAVTGDDQLANEHTDNKGDVEHGQHDEPAKAGISVTSNDTDEMLATLIVGTVEAAQQAKRLSCHRQSIRLLQMKKQHVMRRRQIRDHQPNHLIMAKMMTRKTSRHNPNAL